MGEPGTAPSIRFRSIDILRGAVVVLMAIDHVRVYSGLPAGGPTAGIFFTRWVTHFCAPAFVFLAGTSAWLHGRRHAGLARFLVTRGAWLIVLELTLLRLAWTFNAGFGGYNMAGVIWVLGWAMIALAALSKLPVKVVGAIGVGIIALHNLIPLPYGTDSTAWKLSYVGFFSDPVALGPEGGPTLVVLYTFIPWIGVMAAGYAFGRIIEMEPARRDRLCLRIGLGATLLFILLRATNLYGDPRPWPGEGPMPAWLAFLDTSKYPASFQFLLMTLGPTIALVPLAERARSGFARAMETFGKVPFFFYVLHIPLIHAMALVVSQLRLGTVSPWLFEDHPMGVGPAPEGYAWGLGTLHLVWFIAVVLLYFACRWYAGYKATHRAWWLKYL
jgi:uncharacterized membrane protein